VEPAQSAKETRKEKTSNARSPEQELLLASLFGAHAGCHAGAGGLSLLGLDLLLRGELVGLALVVGGLNAKL